MRIVGEGDEVVTHLGMLLRTEPIASVSRPEVCFVTAPHVAEPAALLDDLASPRQQAPSRHAETHGSKLCRRSPTFGDNDMF